MYRLTFLLLLVLLLPALPVRAQDGAEPDIYRITPEEVLTSADGNERLAEAHRAYQEGQFEEAARLYLAHLRINPGDANSIYNLACCFGLLGAEEQAARWLAAAWTVGFRDLDHVRGDPDFDPVRESEAFVDLMERLTAAEEQAKAARGTLLPVEAKVLASVRIVAPEEAAEKRLPLLIALHGYGDNGENFARLFRARGIESPFLFAVAQAPYAFGTGGNPSFSWNATEGEMPARWRSLALAERYVLDVLSAIKERYAVDERKVFLLGFSQGASLAFRIGLEHPELFAGVIPIGGWVDPGEYTPAETRAATGALFLITHSPDDRVVPFSAAEEAALFCAEHRIPHALLR